MTRVLVVGGAGMLGHKLLQRWAGRFEVAGTIRGRLDASPLAALDLGVPIFDRVAADDLPALERVLGDFAPAVAVNGVGIVKQLEDAQDPVRSIGINALFPHRLAQACATRGVRLIQISTDCVFSGRQGPYTERDPADADDLYGRTKRLGEVAGPGCCTLRTSIIGRELTRGTGLLEWFLRQDGGTIRGFRQALYTGFTTLAFAEILERVIVNHTGLEGLWHVSSEAISKYDLLTIVRDQYRMDVRIEADDEFHCDRRLDSNRFRDATGFMPQPWREMIADMHADPAHYAPIRQEND